MDQAFFVAEGQSTAHIFAQLDHICFRQGMGTLVGLQDKDVVILCGGEEMRFPLKATALVKPVVDMAGVEDVDFSEAELEASDSDDVND